jgi:hypothetical protein
VKRYLEKKLTRLAKQHKKSFIFYFKVGCDVYLEEMNWKTLFGEKTQEIFSYPQNSPPKEPKSNNLRPSLSAASSKQEPTISLGHPRAWSMLEVNCSKYLTYLVAIFSIMLVS